MASDLKSDLVMTAFQRRPTVYLMGNPAVLTMVIDDVTVVSFYIGDESITLVKYSQRQQLPRQMFVLRLFQHWVDLT